MNDEQPSARRQWWASIAWEALVVIARELAQWAAEKIKAWLDEDEEEEQTEDDE